MKWPPASGPFDGKSQVGVLAAILERDPEPISTVQPMTPPALEKLIRTCLAKDPDQRWQSAHDLKLQLEAISEMGSKAGVPAVVAGARRERKRLGTIFAIAGWVLALAGLVAALLYSRRLSEEQQPVRVDIELPSGVDMSMNSFGGAVISPDGKKLAIPAAVPNGSELWVRDLTTGKAASIPGSQGVEFPFWSPDSKMIGFFSHGKLRTVPAAGGPVQIICDAPAGRGGAWSQAGMIVFTPNIEEPLYKVAESGGIPVAVTKLEATGHTHRNPIFLPDGKHFLFTRRLVAGTVGDLYGGSLDGSEPKLVVQQASNGEYAQGYLLYLHDRNLMAQHFDPRSMAVSGNPIPVTENVEYWGPKDLGNFSVSTAGTLVYRKAQTSESRFAWVKLPGKESEEFGDTISGITYPISVSADAKKIAFPKREPNAPDTDLWLFDAERQIMTRQTFNVPGFIYSAFSPDGAKLAITASIGTRGSMRIRTLATGAEQVIPSGIQDIAYVHSWTPDGQYLIVSIQDPKTLFDIYAQPTDGGKPIPLLTQSYDERDGVVSPNGKWMAYLSDESGRLELYVTDFPGAHSKMQVSSEGSFWHDWSHDGKRLYFANGKKLMATEIRNPETMELGGTALVTTLDAQPLGFGSDGRLLVLKSANGQQTEPLRMVLHFPESLEK